ncbi:unnamed protein product [Microthlaspi erraticum]|uniref:H15 domain-containing protein n=1 Tax=Microthlaspi erraticum TaxID=1685480 RepID=A0A6D2I370_9BRAS|nr:unnamed protein product [Microthlaspi erraticum]
MAKAKIESPKTRAASEDKSKKPRKSKTASHPPYFLMIKEALMTLKEKNGSSPYAIAKKIENKHKSTLPENFRKTLSLQLKNSVAKGKLTKIRASYKLSETTTTTRTTRQQLEKKKKPTRSSKNTMPLNKPEVATKKKRKTKKPRQPKSIKSSGSKKVLRASAT